MSTFERIVLYVLLVDMSMRVLGVILRVIGTVIQARESELWWRRR